MLYKPSYITSASIRYSPKMNRQQQQIALRAQIVALRETGLPIRSIAQRLAVSPTTVSKWIRRHAETGNLTDLGKQLLFTHTHTHTHTHT